MTSSTHERNTRRSIHRMHPSEDGSPALSEGNLSMTSPTYEKNTVSSILKMQGTASDMIGGMLSRIPRSFLRGGTMRSSGARLRGAKTSRTSRRFVQDGKSACIRILAVLILMIGSCSAMNENTNPWLMKDAKARARRAKRRAESGGQSLDQILKQEEENLKTMKCEFGKEFEDKDKAAKATMNDEEKAARFEQTIMGGLIEGIDRNPGLPSKYKPSSIKGKTKNAKRKVPPEILEAERHLERVKEIFLAVITEHINDPDNECVAKGLARKGDVKPDDFWDGHRKYDHERFSANFRESLNDPTEWDKLIGSITKTLQPARDYKCFNGLLTSKEKHTWMDFRRCKKFIINATDAIKLFNQMEERRLAFKTTKTDLAMESAMELVRRQVWTQEDFDAWLKKPAATKEDLQRQMERSNKAKAEVFKPATTIQEIITRAEAAKNDPALQNNRCKHPSFGLRDQLIVKEMWRKISDYSEKEKNDPSVLTKLREQYNAKAEAVKQQRLIQTEKGFVKSLKQMDRIHGTEHYRAYLERKAAKEES